MNKLQKIGMALSCFLLLYIILTFKNVLKICELTSVKEFDWKTFDFMFNISMIVIWIVCILWSIIAILEFNKSFLQAYNIASENVIIQKSENITSDYYFTYFSLFVLTFFTVDPTKWTDIVILFLLMLFIVLVYVNNDMWFINPVLNVIGFKSFKVTYTKTGIESKLFEIQVFARNNLNKEINREHKIAYSLHDFSVCYNEKSNI